MSASIKWQRLYIYAPRVMKFISTVKERLDNGTLTNSTELFEIARRSFLTQEYRDKQADKGACKS